MLQRRFRKDTDIPDMADLTVLWRNICFLVVTNWFLCTETANDNTRIVFCYFGTPPRNSSAIPECFRNVHHLYHLSDCLAVVDLDMPLDELSLTLAMIYMR